MLLDDITLFNVFVRFLLLICVYLLRQLPLRMNARLHPKKFAEAFSTAASFDRQSNSAQDINSRVYAEPWSFAPTGYTRTPSAPENDPAMTDEDKQVKTLRDNAVIEWTSTQATFMKFMPSQLGRTLEGQALLMNKPVTRRKTGATGPKRPREDDDSREAKRKLLFL